MIALFNSVLEPANFRLRKIRTYSQALRTCCMPRAGSHLPSDESTTCSFKRKRRRLSSSIKPSSGKLQLINPCKGQCSYIRNATGNRVRERVGRGKQGPILSQAETVRGVPNEEGIKWLNQKSLRHDLSEAKT